MGRAAHGLAMAALAAIVGCGGGSNDDSFGTDPDFSTLDAQLSTPTGTLSASGVSRAVDAVNALQSPAVSVVALSRVTPSRTTCDALAHGDASGTCACPDGGTLAYDFSAIVDARAHKGAPQPITLRARLVQCGVGGVVLDGLEYAQLDGDTTVIDATVDVARTGETPVSVDVWRTASTWWARAGVADGAIVVGVDTDAKGAPAESDVTVKDRTATWTCAMEGGASRCTSASGGTRDLQT